MKPEEYKQAALRTENTPSFITHARRGLVVSVEQQTGQISSESAKELEAAIAHDQMLSRMMHAILGMITELGELCDPLKRHLIYDAALDVKSQEKGSVREERGDQEWYAALFDAAIEAKLEDIWVRNIAKLRARFPDKFTEEKALNRDLDAEQKALESPIDDQIMAVLKDFRSHVMMMSGGSEQAALDAMRTLRGMITSTTSRPVFVREHFNRVAAALYVAPPGMEPSTLRADTLAELCLNEIAALKTESNMRLQALNEIREKILAFAQSNGA